MESQTIARIQSVFKEYDPAEPFDFKFVNEDYQALYTAENRISVLSRYFAGLAIVISCLGLFGMAAFTAQRRQKEIGIRKVLGAGVPQLVSMLSREFVLLVGISTVIAAPVAGWGVYEWLQNFAYRTSMPWWIFVLAGFAATVIALLTISLQTIRAAMANPVKSLRVE